jgi:hypothetical protein
MRPVIVLILIFYALRLAPLAQGSRLYLKKMSRFPMVEDFERSLELVERRSREAVGLGYFDELSIIPHPHHFRQP